MTQQHHFKIDGNFLCRTNHLGKLVMRDYQKLLFVGYPEIRIARFFELRDNLQKLKPTNCIATILSQNYQDKNVLRSQLESFFAKLNKRISQLEPSFPISEHPYLTSNTELMTDKQLIDLTLLVIEQSQQNPELFEQVHVNGATHQSLAIIVNQFLVATNDAQNTSAQQLLYNIEIKAICSELCHIMRELCNEGQRLWENVNVSNYEDYLACGKASLHQAVTTLS
jgi:hypothetical protein